MTTWTVGAVSVTRVEEQLGFASLPPEKYLAGFERAVLERHLAWLVPNHYSPARDRLITSVHSWLIRTPRHTILVDCCAGNHKDRPGFARFHQLETPFLDRLRAAGVAPEEIDIVLCTHLHSDHVGWNTMRRDGHWVPTFPNARYLFSRAENEYGDPRRNPAGRRRSAAQQRLSRQRAAGDRGRSGGPDRRQPCHRRRTADRACARPHRRACRSSSSPTGRTRAVLRRRAASSVAGPCTAVELGLLRIAGAGARDAAPRAWSIARRSDALLFPTHFGAPHVAAITRAGDAFTPRFVDGR